MNYRTFGRTGWQVSDIGYGMWGMGGWTESDDDESRQALQLAVELGCTFFDTAWGYGAGHSEGLLGELVSIGTLLAFVIVCASIIVLRRKRPDLPRPFRTPMVPLVPILGILVCFGMMAFLPKDTWIRLIVWMGIGFVIYFAYGKSHARTVGDNAAEAAR